MEKDLLPAAGKESTGVISKGVPSLSKGVWGFYLESLQTHAGGCADLRLQFEAMHYWSRKDSGHIFGYT